MGNDRSDFPMPHPLCPMPLYTERTPGAESAPTLVLAHAFGGSSRTWRGTVEALGGSMPTVAVDLCGWGASAPPDRGADEASGGFSVADMADSLARVASDLGLTRWALVGHSMSGKAAVALAARRPAGLLALVLVAPSPPTPEPMTDADRARLRAAWGDRAEAERIVRSVVVRPLAPEVFETAVEDHLRASHAAWTAWLDAGSREDVSALAAQVAVPTLVVAGSDDAALGEDVQRATTLRLVPGARLETVRRAGHFVPLDAPADLAALLRAHVLRS